MLDGVYLMCLFNRFRKFIACAILTSFIPSQAWAQGITVPAGSTLNINGGKLTVAGDLINAGTLGTAAGTITLTADGTSVGSLINSGTYNGGNGTVNLVGNWTDSGTFNPGMGTVDFDAGGAFNQNVGIGTTSNLPFWNLVHNSTGTVKLNSPVTINNIFNNSSGTFLANGYGMTVGGTIAGNVGIGTWNNTSTFTSGGNAVTLAGGNQSVLGSTSFYQFTKTYASGGPYTLTFDSGGTQNFANSLTMGGYAGNPLALRSTTSGTQAKIYLSLTGGQSIDYVDVKDSNAGDAAAQQTLVGRHASLASPSQNNTNWDFNNATITWAGGTSTDWNNVINWSPMVVPAAGDSVLIPGGTPFEPTLTSSVNIGTLTVGSSATPATAASATLTLNGFNLTVTSGANTFINKGTVILKGSETVSLTQDTTNGGTFEFLGSGASPYTLPLTSFDNLVIDDPTNSDTFAQPASTNMTVAGNLTITSGTLIAPGGGNTLTVGGNWTNNGAFTHSSGTVIFTGNTTFVGSTEFYNFTANTPGTTLQFPISVTSSPPSVEQMIDGAFNVNGASGSPVTLQPSSAGTWYIKFPNAAPAQSVTDLNVTFSSALTNNITCFSCDTSTPAGDNINTFNNDNANWIFVTLGITNPSPTGTPTVGQKPTIIGVGPPSTNLFIKGIVGGVSVIVASVKTDVNGNFRVTVGDDRAHTGIAAAPVLLDLGSNTLTPYVTSIPGSPGPDNTITVVSSPTSDQVPTITYPTANSHLSGNTPTITGTGLTGQMVTVKALIYQGANLVLEPVGSGTVVAGAYSVTLSTPLPSLMNYISVTVNGVASAVVPVSLTDPYGFVFDSSTNTIIPVATVSIYRASDNQLAQPSICDVNGHITTLKDLACTDVNPFVTGPTSSNATPGLYNFLARPGNYYITASATAYNYPSKLTTFPAGRVVVTGSQGTQFTVGNTVQQIDLPMDGANTLLRITKTANKSEVSVGDIVMYTINIQNISPIVVNQVLINDQTPPGFKYIKDRVLLNSAPTSEPSGQRPLVFNVGSIGIGASAVLQYQLVVGSGVTMGNYQNTATARYASGLVISNPAQASVKIVPDPVFDLGSVIGKVFFDWNENGIQDPPNYDAVSHETIVEKPVPNVQIVMEDGTIITTDRDGKFNIPGLLPGRHLFRLDERSLPPGAYLTTDKATIVDVTAGSISKVNFGVNIDETLTKGRDAVFFNEKIRLTQDRNRPVPRLNVALFDASANADPKTEEIVLQEGALVRQAEFRIFTNYSPFISGWHLDIMDTDTRKVIRTFQGTPLNINDPIYWNGRDDQDIIINPDHKYSYILTVNGTHYNHDDTKEKSITIRQIKDDISLKKELDESKDVFKDRAERYRKWLDAQAVVNNVDHQLIEVKGETIHLDRQGTDVKSIHVMKGNNLFIELPLTQQYGLTPEELMASGFSMVDQKDNLEIILPNGDYTLDVISAKTADNSSGNNVSPVVPQSVPTAGGMPSRTASVSSGTLEHYSRPLKVGDDYMMFVALGDAQVGYNIDRGNIEPIQDRTQEPGFYEQGKGAFYLKGQILGKYLVTSSFDSDRAQKALFRQLDPNVYYPVYGDKSSINYDATDTQGPLYLKVEWDKSTAILGNYAVDFNDTEFAAFSRDYYGGKIDYQSVASNPYGDARTKLVIYHAQIQQLPSHNEFLATGGSLYFLKYMNVVQGSDTVSIQVRDQTTGLVIASQTMTNGADYELDNSQGRILFWEPVAMIAQSASIISNSLINGDPIYVVVDYQYAVTGMQIQGAQGARVAQGIGDNVVLGGTYVQDNSSGQNYSLEGTDATLHVNKDSTIKAEYAQTASQEEGSYVSTDGGITFATLSLNNDVSGKAYGIKGDTRLFDNIGLKSYYKWIGSDFGATDSSSQQGTEKMGLSMTFDMTPVTRLTASEDIQKLLAGGNIQSSTQVGATETDTTMVQIVHTAQRLTLTGQFQLVETKSVINGVESTTNQRGATLAGQAQYDLTNRIKLTLGQQVDVQNPSNTATTLGVAARMTDHMTLNGQEVFGQQGRATTVGVTNQIGKRIALTTDLTQTNLNTGEVDKTASVGVEDQINKNLTTTGTVATTTSSLGTTTTTANIGAKAKISQGMTVDMNVGKSQNAFGTQSDTSVNLNGTTQIGNTTVTGTASGGTNVSTLQGVNAPGLTPSLVTPTTSTTTTAATAFGVTATTKVNEMTSTNGSVNVMNDTSGNRTTTFGFGNNSQLDQELQAVTSNSFSFSPTDGTTDTSKYGLVRTVNGQKAEADFTKASLSQPTNITESNIFGLSGDVNDRVALNASIERGKVQNLGTSQTNRTDFTFGSGYVLKDTETAEERLKNSIKLEYRVDQGIGTDSLHQYVLYDAVDGKITDNFTVNAKVDFSKTIDTTSGATAERHQEIILGTAYRPVNYDKLNLIAEYSYQDGYGGGLQQADALNTNVMTTTAQVFSAEAVYDINDQWQTADKIAYRIMNEQDTGFAFTATHTWLVVHRLNYKIDPHWTLSGEIRDLAQVEAKDNKAGLLLEATRDINANTELAIGWNFTKYSDDLTNLSYSSMGPFVRMTGKFYDETPEEKARARAKWLDAKISQWAWAMIRRELGKKDSRIVLELNSMFVLAKASQKAGNLEEARQIYKDIITAGQIMYNEAYEYIRTRIDFEEQLQKLDKSARDYFRGGEYVKARKIWEKVVEDASKGVVK